MARIRSIHPGIFTDEAFMALTVESPLAVALLLGLWTDADDNGIFEWKPLSLKARLLPAITSSIEPLLETLIAHRFIARYEIGKRQLGAIRNFTRFQRPKKPKSVHPMTPEIGTYVGLSADGSRPNPGSKEASSELDTGSGDDSSEPEPSYDGDTGEVDGAQPSRVRNRFPTSTEPVPKKGEKSPQMEDGGGRKDSLQGRKNSLEDHSLGAGGEAADPGTASLGGRPRVIPGGKP